ncbi:MAG: biotin synthase BioB [Deltaproteobacteria bacterium]|nr:biotin synthase BioB [Deltaproteobacteria bacterium]
MNAEQIRELSAQADLRPLTGEEVLAMVKSEGEDAFDALMDGAESLRRKYKGNDVSLCAIVNAKSGKCGENCGFCAQSVHFDTGVSEYDFIGKDAVLDAAKRARQMGAREFSMVLAGRKIRKKEIRIAQEIFPEIQRETGMSPCCSPGAVNAEDVAELKAAGLNMFHHNLETARSHYAEVCGTRDYDDNRRAVEEANKAGLFTCCGGIFGMGETWEQRVELLLDLRELDVDSVPINFLNPIPGTPMENFETLPEEECLRIIALARHLMPTKQILIAGGRQVHLKDRQKDIFRAGASGMMIGDYLTTKGADPWQDHRMLEELGMSIAPCDKHGGHADVTEPVASPIPVQPLPTGYTPVRFVRSPE